MIKNLLVSFGEKLTDRLLVDLFSHYKYSINRKVRLADIFDINDSCWSKDEKDFILKSHFDFLITTSNERKPLIAIEYDGEYHKEKKQIERDILKNKICKKANLPICRFTFDDINFKNGIQPALDKLYYNPKTRVVVYSKFLNKLNTQQRPIQTDYFKWLFEIAHFNDFLPLPTISEVYKRITKLTKENRNSLFIFNSLKWGTCLEIAKMRNKKGLTHNNNIIDYAVEELVCRELNNKDLQQFLLVILREETMKLCKLKDINEYIEYFKEEDSDDILNSWNRFHN